MQDPLYRKHVEEYDDLHLTVEYRNGCGSWCITANNKTLAKNGNYSLFRSALTAGRYRLHRLVNEQRAADAKRKGRKKHAMLMDLPIRADRPPESRMDLSNIGTHRPVVISTIASPDTLKWLDKARAEQCFQPKRRNLVASGLRQMSDFEKRMREQKRCTVCGAKVSSHKNNGVECWPFECGECANQRSIHIL